VRTLLLSYLSRPQRGEAGEEKDGGKREKKGREKETASVTAALHFLNQWNLILLALRTKKNAKKKKRKKGGEVSLSPQVDVDRGRTKKKKKNGKRKESGGEKRGKKGFQPMIIPRRHPRIVCKGEGKTMQKRGKGGRRGKRRERSGSDCIMLSFSFTTRSRRWGRKKGLEEEGNEEKGGKKKKETFECVPRQSYRGKKGKKGGKNSRKKKKKGGTHSTAFRTDRSFPICGTWLAIQGGERSQEGEGREEKGKKREKEKKKDLSPTHNVFPSSTSSAPGRGGAEERKREKRAEEEGEKKEKEGECSRPTADGRCRRAGGGGNKKKENGEKKRKKGGETGDVFGCITPVFLLMTLLIQGNGGKMGEVNEGREGGTKREPCGATIF